MNHCFSCHALALAPMLTTALLAQVPTDAIVVLETGTAIGQNYTYVDVLGRGITPVLGQNVLLQPPPVSVAVDPTGATNFFFQANPSSLAGTWRFNTGLLGNITQAQWGSWLRTAGERVEVGTTRVFTLRSGAVESYAKAPTPQIVPATLLFNLPGAVDLAVLEPFVYVVSDNAGTATVVEYDLTTAGQRTIGTYGSARSIAVSPFGGELTLGLQSGDLQRIAISNGAVLATTTTGLGALLAVGYARLGTLVWTDGQQLWSELVPNAPLYVSSTGIRDFGVASWPVATATPYGTGCARGATVTWSVPSAPALGNAAFALGLRNGVPTSFALLAVGIDRAQAPSIGQTLPYDLQLLGAPGCRLLVDPAVLTLRATNVFGETDQPLPIPATPTLAGLEVVAQWLVPDNTVGTLGLATSPALAAAIY
jgi:hypothetical protein